MICLPVKIIFIGFVFFLQSFCIHAQPEASIQNYKRIQYPGVLSNSFFGVGIGYISYPFSTQQLEAGYRAESVHVPHTAVRIVLYGHQFNKYLSAQITYMRPVDWVGYRNINGDGLGHSVWMNMAGVTMKAQSALWKKFSVYGEAGLSIITRRGFSINNVPVVRHANYATVIAGAGLQYQINRKWDLVFSTVYSPKNANVKQPHSIVHTAGFIYTMRPITEAVLKTNAATGYIFPKKLFQLGYTTNALSYGVNNFVSKGAIPIFWGGDVKIRQGVSLNFSQNIFHTNKVFSLDFGAGISYWKSRKNNNSFFTMSLFPVLRFTTFRSKGVDIYFNYSVAGPTFISKIIIDNSNTGKHFTFQDFMGMGFYMGARKTWNAEIRIMHYSNGNIFTDNVGLMIPLTFMLGMAF